MRHPQYPGDRGAGSRCEIARQRSRRIALLVFCDEDADNARSGRRIIGGAIGRGRPPLAVLIGPEGGFAEDERAMLLRRRQCRAAGAGSAHSARRHRRGGGACAGSGRARRLALIEGAAASAAIASGNVQDHDARHHDDGGRQAQRVADNPVEERRDRAGADRAGVENSKRARVRSGVTRSGTDP